MTGVFTLVRSLGTVLVVVMVAAVFAAAWVYDLTQRQILYGLIAVAVLTALYDGVVVNPTRPPRR